MVEIVAGHDAYVGCQIAEQDTNFDTPITLDTTTLWRRVPLLSETFSLQRDTLPKSREFGTTGALSFIETGRAIVRGSITCRFRYDAPYTAWLLGYFFGDEAIILNEWLNGSDYGASPASGNEFNTHSFTWGAVPNGLTIRMFKSGSDDGGFYDQITGAIPSRLTIEQPEADAATMTVDFVAKSILPVDATGKSLVVLGQGTEGGIVPVKARDIRTPAGETERHFHVFTAGSGAGVQLNHTSFTLTIDRNIDFDAAFTNDPTTVTKPSVTETRDVTLRVNGLLEQFQPIAGQDVKNPYYQYINNIDGSVDIRWCSDTRITGGVGASPANAPYGLRVHLPNGKWTEAQNPLSGPGSLPTSAVFTAASGPAWDEATLDVSGSSVRSANTPADVRVFMCASKADSGRGVDDKTFTLELPSSN